MGTNTNFGAGNRLDDGEWEVNGGLEVVAEGNIVVGDNDDESILLDEDFDEHKIYVWHVYTDTGLALSYSAGGASRRVFRRNVFDSDELYIDNDSSEATYYYKVWEMKE